jgi:hypothetical protein
VTTKMCFVAGTKVHTPDGLKNIEDIRPGDWVLSRDEPTGEQAYKPVVETIVTHPDALYTIAYDPDGPGGRPAEQLVTTAPHPFWVVDAERFVAAEDLKLGDHFLLAHGGMAEVAGLTVDDAPEGTRTYNFEVADFHTYFVGEEGVWVHNAGNAHCEKMLSLYRRFRTNAPFAETPYETLVRIKDRLAESKAIPGAVWRLAAKEVSDEMFKKVASGHLPLNKLPSYAEWKSRFSPGLGSLPSQVDDIHVHHAVERWIQRDKLGLTDDYDAVPGFLIEGPRHTPSKGSLANRLRNEVGPINGGDPLAVTTKIKEIYESEGLTDLWGVTKQWLQSKGIPTPG